MGEESNRIMLVYMNYNEGVNCIQPPQLYYFPLTNLCSHYCVLIYNVKIAYQNYIHSS